MKLKIGFFILLLFAFDNAIGQKHFTITYQSEKFNEIVPKEFELKNPFDLIVHDSIALAYYENKFTNDSSNVNLPMGSYLNYKFLYMNKNSSINVRYKGGKNKEDILVEKNHPKTKWNFLEGEKFILGYKCRKAKGKIGNYRYEIWFTEDLKSPFGPFIYTNLPGTVLLSINKTKGLLTCATAIKNEALPIVEPNFAKRVKE